MKGVKEMVLSFLPYEDDFNPTTKQATIIKDIFDMIVEQDTTFKEWEGFTMYTLKKIDKSKTMQDHVDKIINNILPVLDGYVHEK